MRWQLTGPLSHGRKFCSTLFYAVPHCYTNFELHRERVGRIRTPNCLTTTARCLRPRPPLMNHWATVAFLRRPSRRRHGGNAGQKQNRRLHEPTLPVVPRRLVNALQPSRRPAAPSPRGPHVHAVLRSALRWRQHHVRQDRFDDFFCDARRERAGGAPPRPDPKRQNRRPFRLFPSSVNYRVAAAFVRRF